MRAKQLHLQAKFGRQPQIIRIHESEELATCNRHASISRGTLTSIRLPQVSDLTSKLPDRILCIIRRTVIHNYDLYIPVVLVQHGPQGVPNIARSIERGNNDTY